MKNIFLLIGVLAILLCSSALAVSFTDTAGHWGEPYIQGLADKGVINGYLQDDGTYIFKPEGEVTKAEFMKLVISASLPNEDWSKPGVKYNHWSSAWIERAEKADVISEGYVTETTANNAISRADVVEILGKCDILLRKTAQEASELDFYDISSLSGVQAHMLSHCVARNYIQGYEDYTFKPNKTLTRAEVATILSRYM